MFKISFRYWNELYFCFSSLILTNFKIFYII
uniref:Chromosome region maintenance protein n=1 Tax=Siphoviridae sp. ctHip2 TaxID=2827830 RepID=A0A8S5RVU3_9CAUD|nr:MAG TPA: Chromosome region maintenance protein [Siphoviridae sp. ctHip2]